MFLKANKIPEATITRLSVYSRVLQILEKNGTLRVSSEEIAQLMDGTAAQVRKDLAYFGEFGTRGIGYDVSGLNKNLMKVLGLNKGRNVAIVGAGRVGRSLALYSGFEKRGFRNLGIFDVEHSRVGGQVGELTVMSMNEIDDFVKEHNVQMGVVAVPAFYAQEVANCLIKAGVRSLLNFAPVSLVVPLGFPVRYVDLSILMETLSFYMGIEEQKEIERANRATKRSAI